MPESNKHVSRNVEEILKVLETADFEEWYSTRFEYYITGEEGGPTKDQILEDLYQLLN
jgi:hypothetical protein